MVKLLSANFLRLIQDKIFRGGLILTAAWGVIVPVKRHMDALQYDYTDEIENGFLSYALFAAGPGRHCHGGILQPVPRHGIQ